MAVGVGGRRGFLAKRRRRMEARVGACCNAETRTCWKQRACFVFVKMRSGK